MRFQATSKSRWLVLAQVVSLCSELQRVTHEYLNAGVYAAMVLLDISVHILTISIMAHLGDIQMTLLE